MANQKSGNTEYTLILRWLLINALGTVFIVLSWKSGWIADVLALDTLYISRAIAVFTGLALLGCTWRIWKTSRDLNVAQLYVRSLLAGDETKQSNIEGGTSRVATYITEIKGLNPDGRREMSDMLADDIGISMTSVGYNISRLAALGFIGTLVGIAIALKVFDIPLTDSSQVLALFNKVPPGLRIAVYPALLGSIGAMWLDFQFQVLDEGTQKLISWIRKAGVHYAQQQST